MFVLDEPASRVVGIEVGEEVGTLARHAEGLCGDDRAGGEVVAEDIDATLWYEAGTC